MDDNGLNSEPSVKEGYAVTTESPSSPAPNYEESITNYDDISAPASPPSSRMYEERENPASPAYEEKGVEPDAEYKQYQQPEEVQGYVYDEDDLQEVENNKEISEFYSNPSQYEEQPFPVSPGASEGQISDEDGMEYENFDPNTGAQTPSDGQPHTPLSPAPQSDPEDENTQQDGQRNKSGKLGKLRGMRFKGPKSLKPRASAPPRRTVRSFLDEKGAEDLDVTGALAARPTKSEHREERAERRKKKKRNHEEREKAEPKEPKIAPVIEGRPYNYNPHTIASKVHTIIARIDAANAEGAQVPDDEIRNLLYEAIALEQEMQDTIDKRGNLMTEMEGWKTAEKDKIKEMHEELPDDIKSTITINEDSIEITDGPFAHLNAEKPTAPMFPQVPSLLGDNAPTFLGATSNNLQFHSLTELFNGARRENGDEHEPGSPNYEGNGARTPKEPMMWSNQNGSDEIPTSLPSYIQPDFHNVSITFCHPPISCFEPEGDNGASYQMPPNPGAPGAENLSKTITSMITRMVVGVSRDKTENESPQGVAPLMSNILGGGPSSPDREAKPPSLMSLHTMAPFDHGSPLLGFRTGRDLLTGRSTFDSPLI